MQQLTVILVFSPDDEVGLPTFTAWVEAATRNEAEDIALREAREDGYSSDPVETFVFYGWREEFFGSEED